MSKERVLSAAEAREMLQLDVAMDHHIRYNHVPQLRDEAVVGLKRVGIAIVRRFNGLDPNSEPDHDLSYVVEGVKRRDGSPVTAQEFVDDWHLHDFLNADDE